MRGGMAMLLGPMMEEDGPVDADRAAALAALRRFRDSKDDEVALEAFLSLCRYADKQGEDTGDYGGG